MKLLMVVNANKIIKLAIKINMMSFILYFIHVLPMVEIIANMTMKINNKQLNLNVENYYVKMNFAIIKVILFVLIMSMLTKMKCFKK